MIGRRSGNDGVGEFQEEELALQSGLVNVEGRLIPNRGHNAADERPDEVVAILRKFINQITLFALDRLR